MQKLSLLINKADGVRTLNYAEASTINPNLKMLVNKVLQTEVVTALLIGGKVKFCLKIINMIVALAQIGSYPSPCTKP